MPVGWLGPKLLIVTSPMSTLVQRFAGQCPRTHSYIDYSNGIEIGCVFHIQIDVTKEKQEAGDGRARESSGESWRSR